MTTCIYDRQSRIIGADTQNTTPSGGIVRVGKIEFLEPIGYYFLGSGHCYTIGQCRLWAESGFAADRAPDWDILLSDPDEYGFSCVVIDPLTNRVWLIDDEMVPNLVTDRFVAVGSGADCALGALDAGATVQQALEIAAARDPNTSGPFHVREI